MPFAWLGRISTLWVSGDRAGPKTDVRVLAGSRRLSSWVAADSGTVQRFAAPVGAGSGVNASAAQRVDAGAADQHVVARPHERHDRKPSAVHEREVHFGLQAADDARNALAR